MKLSNKAIKEINTQECRLHLALALGFSETWVRGLISKNKDNGPLTTAQALEVIRRVTKLKDGEILKEAEKIRA